MAWAPSLIPGLDDVIKNGDPRRRAEAAHKISELFLAGAAQFRPQHVDLFDGILTGLVPHTEIASRADLAERLSMLGNAPPALGQHNRELLKEIGLSVDACQDLEKSGVVCGVMPAAS